MQTCIIHHMRVLFLPVLFSVGIASPAFASSLAVDFSSPTYLNSLSSRSMGFSFQANNALSVVALGTYDYQQDGLRQQNGSLAPQQVGLWDSSQVLLASVFVDNSDPLQGSWRFAAISPITLTAGSTYFVASQGGEGYAAQLKALTVNPGITYLRGAWSSTVNLTNSPLAFPNSAQGDVAAQGAGFFGANFEIASTPAPEPSSMALFGLGAAAIGLGRRRRSQSRTAAR